MTKGQDKESGLGRIISAFKDRVRVNPDKFPIEINPEFDFDPPHFFNNVLGISEEVSRSIGGSLFASDQDDRYDLGQITFDNELKEKIPAEKLAKAQEYVAYLRQRYPLGMKQFMEDRVDREKISHPITSISNK